MTKYLPILVSLLSACSVGKGDVPDRDMSDAGTALDAATPASNACRFNGAYEISYTTQNTQDSGACPDSWSFRSFLNNETNVCSRTSNEVDSRNGTALQVSYVCGQAESGAVEQCSGVAVSEEGCVFGVGIRLVGRVE